MIWAWWFHLRREIKLLLWNVPCSISIASIRYFNSMLQISVEWRCWQLVCDEEVLQLLAENVGQNVQTVWEEKAGQEWVLVQSRCGRNWHGHFPTNQCETRVACWFWIWKVCRIAACMGSVAGWLQYQVQHTECKSPAPPEPVLLCFAAFLRVPVLCGMDNSSLFTKKSQLAVSCRKYKKYCGQGVVHTSYSTGTFVTLIWFFNFSLVGDLFADVACPFGV